MSKEDYSLEIGKFELLENIGSGQYAIVYKLKEKDSGNIYAAKISRRTLNKETDQKTIIQNLIREVSIICKLDHPSIIQFIGFCPKDFHNNLKPIIVTEYATNGSLRSLIEAEIKGLSDHRWNDTQKLITLYGIASAMLYLHLNKIVHRDLKPDNILMNEDLYPKVGDFGLSKILHFNEESLAAASKSGFKGTYLYSAPEILLENEYSTSGDVYSFGMIAFEIYTTQIPFEKCSLHKLIKNVISGVRPEFKFPLPSSYTNLIESCWAQDSKDRPTFEQIVNILKTDEGFITDTVDEIEFFNFVDYIDNYHISFKSDSSVSSLDEYLDYDKNSDFRQTITSFKTKTSIKAEIKNYETKEEEITEFFSQFGEISKVFISRPINGRFFVEFKNEQSYLNALYGNYPHLIGANKLFVRKMPPNDTIILIMLPEDTTKNDIIKSFEGYNIVKLSLYKNKENLLIAYVRFETEEIVEEISKNEFICVNGAELPLIISTRQRLRTIKLYRKKH